MSGKDTLLSCGKEFLVCNSQCGLCYRIACFVGIRQSRLRGTAGIVAEMLIQIVSMRQRIFVVVADVVIVGINRPYRIYFGVSVIGYCYLGNGADCFLVFGRYRRVTRISPCFILSPSDQNGTPFAYHNGSTGHLHKGCNRTGFMVVIASVELAGFRINVIAVVANGSRSVVFNMMITDIKSGIPLVVCLCIYCVQIYGFACPCCSGNRIGTGYQIDNMRHFGFIRKGKACYRIAQIICRIFQNGSFRRYGCSSRDNTPACENIAALGCEICFGNQRIAGAGQQICHRFGHISVYTCETLISQSYRALAVIRNEILVFIKSPYRKYLWIVCGSFGNINCCYEVCTCRFFCEGFLTAVNRAPAYKYRTAESRCLIPIAALDAGAFIVFIIGGIPQFNSHGSGGVSTLHSVHKSARCTCR